MEKVVVFRRRAAHAGSGAADQKRGSAGNRNGGPFRAEVSKTPKNVVKMQKPHGPTLVSYGDRSRLQEHAVI